MVLDDGFATDGQGRRVYVPLIGPARWVLSQQAEDEFNRSQFRVTLVTAFLGLVPVAVLASYSDHSASGEFIALVVVARFLMAWRSARRWPAIPAIEYSGEHHVAMANAGRNSAWLCLRLLLQISIFAGAVAVLLWYLLRPPFAWSDLSVLEMFVRPIPPLLVAATLPFIAIGIYRGAIGIRNKLRRAVA